MMGDSYMGMEHTGTDDCTYCDVMDHDGDCESCPTFYPYSPPNPITNAGNFIYHAGIAIACIVIGWMLLGAILEYFTGPLPRK